MNSVTVTSQVAVDVDTHTCRKAGNRYKGTGQRVFSSVYEKKNIDIDQ